MPHYFYAIIIPISKNNPTIVSYQLFESIVIPQPENEESHF
jgi:hypothetical protein